MNTILCHTIPRQNPIIIVVIIFKIIIIPCCSPYRYISLSSALTVLLAISQSTTFWENLVVIRTYEVFLHLVAAQVGGSSTYKFDLRSLPWWLMQRLLLAHGTS